MNSNNNDELEFDVFGFKVSFRPNDENRDFSATDIVKKVMQEGETLKLKTPDLKNGQMAILIALKLMAEKMALEKKFSENIGQLRDEAMDALSYIEEISHPSSPSS